MNNDMVITTEHGNTHHKWTISHTERMFSVVHETKGGTETIYVPIDRKGLRKVGKAIVAFVKFMKATSFLQEPHVVYQHPDGGDIQVGTGLLKITDECGDCINVSMTQEALLVLGKSLIEETAE